MDAASSLPLAVAALVSGASFEPVTFTVNVLSTNAPLASVARRVNEPLSVSPSARSSNSPLGSNVRVEPVIETPEPKNSLSINGVV